MLVVALLLLFTVALLYLLFRRRPFRGAGYGIKPISLEHPERPLSVSETPFADANARLDGYMLVTTCTTFELPNGIRTVTQSHLAACVKKLQALDGLLRVTIEQRTGEKNKLEYWFVPATRDIHCSVVDRVEFPGTAAQLPHGPPMIEIQVSVDPTKKPAVATMRFLFCHAIADGQTAFTWSRQLAAFLVEGKEMSNINKNKNQHQLLLMKARPLGFASDAYYREPSFYQILRCMAAIIPPVFLKKAPALFFDEFLEDSVNARKTRTVHGVARDVSLAFLKKRAKAHGVSIHGAIHGALYVALYELAKKRGFKVQDGSMDSTLNVDIRARVPDLPRDASGTHVSLVRMSVANLEHLEHLGIGGGSEKKNAQKTLWAYARVCMENIKRNLSRDDYLYYTKAISYLGVDLVSFVKKGEVKPHCRGRTNKAFNISNMGRVEVDPWLKSFYWTSFEERVGSAMTFNCVGMNDELHATLTYYTGVWQEETALWVWNRLCDLLKNA